MSEIDESEFRARVNEIASGWPTVGLAVGIVRNGSMELFHGHGLADIASGKPVSEDTVYPIASITKTFTAIAVMQLWERGLLDLDAPANDYLHAYRLVPADPGWRPATVRHLLTHTAGIREVLHLSGLLRLRDLGETVEAGRPVPPLAEFYDGGLRVDTEPGTSFMYTNHGFATLGQIIEDVSGDPLDRYFREHIFKPLGMQSTDLVRPDGLHSRLATGYELRGRGATQVPDYEMVTKAGGGIYSTPNDMARYAAALLGNGANEHGSVLEPETLAMMYQPHYQPDPRIPGIGLAFFRASFGGRRVIDHDGVLPGFDSHLMVAPDDGVGVFAFANGARGGLHWLTPRVSSLLRWVLGVPEEAIRTDLPQHPEIWEELCGWYEFAAQRTDPARLALGPGVEVVVRGGQLVIRALSPIPAMHRGFVLHPDDEDDPYAFRIEIPWFSLGTGRVVFSREPGIGTTAAHLDFAPMSFAKRPANTNPRRRAARALAAMAGAALVADGVRRRVRSCKVVSR